MEITPEILTVLEQKYGPAIRVQVYAVEGKFLQLHIQHSTERPKDLICTVLFANKVSRGTQYHVYEMVHSVFSPH
jgi:hypothetical protein